MGKEINLIRYSIDFTPQTMGKLKAVAEARQTTVAAEIRRGVDMIFIGEKLKEQLLHGQELEP